MSDIRVRFAPSPTGHLHIGGLRTALFNWLFARHHGGTFLVRIEDTDHERSLPQYVDSITDALSWAGIISDEPLVFQTNRMALYHQAVATLLAKGSVYRCFCESTPERIGEAYFRYDGRCRTRTVTPDDEKQPHAIRFAFPQGRDSITFTDLIRGPITFTADQFDDFILVRTDGVPLYNFVVVVDDIAMRISHVIRGEDHISNTPKQILLYEALSAPLPQFAHLPLILGSSGQRLSKRDAATSVGEYKEAGYVPAALNNYLIRLGWSHKDQEIFTTDELISLFSLEGISKHGAIFDQAKLDWLNGMYVRAMADDAIYDYLLGPMNSNCTTLLPQWSTEMIKKLIGLYKGRVKTLKELITTLTMVHNNAIDREQLAEIKKVAAAKEYVNAVHQSIINSVQYDNASIKEILNNVCEQFSIKLVTLAQPVRLALAGSIHGPGIVDLMVVLGKDESVKRLQNFVITYW